jgi:hypothetical protein
MGFTNESQWPAEWYQAVKDIGVKSPFLTSLSSQRSEIRELQYTFVLRQESISPVINAFVQYFFRWPTERAKKQWSIEYEFCV